jgi:hypothetical protein
LKNGDSPDALNAFRNRSLDSNFKNEVIKLFKDEKMSVTKILQEELNYQVAELKKEIVKNPLIF